MKSTQKLKKLHIGDWEACCNDIVDMIVRDRIVATDPETEGFCLYIDGDYSPNLNFCPFCGKGIPVKPIN